MEASAKETYILMSPRKLRRVVNRIRGQRAGKAHQILQLMPYSAYKRFKPRAQGRMYRREKPTSHITLKVKVVQ